MLVCHQINIQEGRLLYVLLVLQRYKTGVEQLKQRPRRSI